jgi:receptor protein-tyrosine kinase
MGADTSALDHIHGMRAAVPKPDSESRIFSLTDPESMGAEVFRSLSTRLRHLQQRNGIKKLVVTSTVSGEGKSLVSTNLAVTLARTHRQTTLLVDGDLRNPAIGRLLGLGNLAGFHEWVGTEEPFWHFIYSIKDFPMYVFPAGAPSAQPLELIETPAVATMLQRVASDFDWIIIDSPPSLSLADASVLARYADGILLVIRQGVTPKKWLQTTIDALEPLNIIGIVVNDLEETQQPYYYYYPQYGHARDRKSSRSAPK